MSIHKSKLHYRNELEKILKTKIPSKEEIDTFLSKEAGMSKLTKEDQYKLVKEKFGSKAGDMFLYGDLLSSDLTKHEENAVMRQIVSDYGLANKYWIGLTDLLVNNHFNQDKNVRIKNLHLFMPDSLVAKQAGYVKEKGQWYFGYPLVMPYLTNDKTDPKIILVLFVYSDYTKETKQFIDFAKRLKITVNNQDDKINLLAEVKQKDAFGKQVAKYGPLVLASQIVLSDIPLEAQQHILSGGIVPICYEVDFKDFFEQKDSKINPKEVTIKINGYTFELEKITNQELSLAKIDYQK